MITSARIKKIICFNFVNWMLFTSIYSWFIFGLKNSDLHLLANSSLVTDTPETQMFKHERGGVRRIGGNSGRNTTKETLSKLV